MPIVTERVSVYDGRAGSECPTKFPACCLDSTDRLSKLSRCMLSECHFVRAPTLNEKSFTTEGCTSNATVIILATLIPKKGLNSEMSPYQVEDTEMLFHLRCICST